MSRIQGFIWQMDSNTGIYVYLCLKMHYVVAVGDKIHNRLLPWRSYTTLDLQPRGNHSIASHCIATAVIILPLAFITAMTIIHVPLVFNTLVSRFTRRLPPRRSFYN